PTSGTRASLTSAMNPLPYAVDHAKLPIVAVAAAGRQSQPRRRRWHGCIAVIARGVRGCGHWPWSADRWTPTPVRPSPCICSRSGGDGRGHAGCNDGCAGRSPAMNAASLPRRFLLRLALPAAAMAALFSAGEPLPEPAPTALVIVQEELRTSTERLRLEAAQL